MNRPSMDQMRKRLGETDAAQLIPVMASIGIGASPTPAWALPSERPVMVWVNVDGQVVQQPQPGFLLYTLRRDGKVRCDGYAVPASKFVVVETL